MSNISEQQKLYDFLDKNQIPYNLAQIGSGIDENQILTYSFINTTKYKLILFFLKSTFIEVAHLSILINDFPKLPTHEALNNKSENQFITELFAPSNNTKIFIDESVLEKEYIYFPVDYKEMYVQLSQTDFRKLIKPTMVDKIAESTSILKLYSRKIKHDDTSIFMNIRLKQRAAEINQMPVLPNTANQLLELSQDKNAGADDLAKIIEQDPSLAAQIIRWASSSYYGFRGDISNVKDAIIKVIGYNLAMNLSLGVALNNVFNVTNNGPIGLDNYWHDAICTAIICELLTINTGNKLNSGIAYLLGLIHNIGYLILGHAFAQLHKNLNNYIYVNPHIPKNLFDRHLLGFGLEDLAAEVMTHWQMPSLIIDSVRYQSHDEYAGENHGYVEILKAASLILQNYKQGEKTSFNIRQISNININQDIIASVNKKLNAKQNEIEILHKTISKPAA